MSTNKSGKFMLVLALVAALAMLMAMTSVSIASGNEPTDNGATVCVSGYVINHREQPVDGTKKFTDPTTGGPLYLTIKAEGAESPDVAASVVVTTTVGADGKYTFKDLPADLYYNFSMQLPVDWDSIVPAAERNGVAATGYAKLVEKKDCYDVLFKIRRWFDVTVLKWEELRNGAVQPGVDWTMTATPQGDPWAVKKSGKTVFVPHPTDPKLDKASVVLTLTPGQWQIAETVKSGWTPITPSSVNITLDQYAPPGAGDSVVFKNLEPVCYATITVEKWGWGTGIDKQGQPMEVVLGPLAGWHITLSRPDGAMAPVTLATDGFGKAVFKNLKPGVYNVTETVQPGWEAKSPNPQQVIITDCEDVRVLFDNLEVVGKLQISGTKYFRAWVPPYQGKTVGLSGWGITATLKGSNPPIYRTTTTDALGNYLFSQADLRGDPTMDDPMDIAGATITVCEEKRDHWIPVSPVCVDVHFPYPVPVDYKGAKVNFTNVQDPPLPGYGSSGGSVNTATCAVTYTVRAGDSLSGIAVANGTSVSALTQLNGLANPNMIRSGQTLCIQ